MANTFKNDVYRNGKIFLYLTIGFLVSLMVCLALDVILGFFLMMFPDKTIALADQESIPIAYLLIGFVEILNIPLFICTVVFFLIWEYRAFNNLSALNARNLEFSPGWAVGWWFIPFANLVKPYQAMSELWNESDPDFNAELGFLSSSAGAPRIMSWWWALFIISNIALRISSAMSEGNVSQITRYFSVALIISSILRAIDAFLLILIVKKITQRQELRFQRLGISNQAVLPPPPNFENNQI